MENTSKNYEMRVNQINSRKFRLKLIDTSPVDRIVFETLSNHIPSTIDLIQRYNQLRILK
jgi:hypothetical protein